MANKANSYYWAVLIKAIAAFKEWPDSTAHDWVKVTWHIKSTQGYSYEESIRLVKLVRAHVKEHWGLEVSAPRHDSGLPADDAEWAEFCRSLEG